MWMVGKGEEVDEVKEKGKEKKNGNDEPFIHSKLD